MFASNSYASYRKWGSDSEFNTKLTYAKKNICLPNFIVFGGDDGLYVNNNLLCKPWYQNIFSPILIFLPSTVHQKKKF
jgi:hypothetical protein